MEYFTKFLKQKLQEEKVITQVELAKKMGITVGAITKWLNGGLIDITKIPLLCECLKCTPNELFGIETPEQRKAADTIFYRYMGSPQYKASIDTLLGLDEHKED